MNIIDYAEETGRFTFDEKPFNAVDSLVLSQLSYLHLNLIVRPVNENAEPIPFYKTVQYDIDQRQFYDYLNDGGMRLLFLAAITSRRYKNVRLAFFDHKLDPDEEKQFCAVTYLLDDETAYVAFRGTDTTLVGWKEDFNMAFMDEIPSQHEALAYLTAVSAKIPGRLIVGGHSKGGNLAVYASVKCGAKIRERVTAIYNHDGPGFSPVFLSSPELKEMEGRIHTFLPRSSIVGMILQQRGVYRIVHCSSFGFFQHDSFSWNVSGADFEYCESLDFGAQVTHRVVNSWLTQVDSAKRQRFVEVLYDMVKSSHASTLSELSADWKKTMLSFLRYARGLDKETRKFLIETIKLMAVFSVESALGRNPQKVKKSAAPRKALADGGSNLNVLTEDSKPR